MKKLAKLKFAIAANEVILIDTITDNFTPFFQPLIPWVNRLQEVVFPNRGWHRWNDERLYSRMKEILLEACENLT